MGKDWRYQAGQAFMVLGMAVLALSTWLTLQHREPFHTWYFLFAWWSYILVLDGWVYRHRGESLLLSYPGRFFFLCVWSAVLWLIFESFNLRLGNWYYLNLPGERLLRWAGYLLAFATVVPGLLETADLIDTAGIVKEARVKPLGWKKRVEPQFMAAGVLMLALPLLFPKYFFPLVWGGFIFLLEPLNERLGAPSLLSDWRQGTLKRLAIMLLSGLVCGLLWEWWNSLSGAGWQYRVPGVGDVKIFEMPVLGYLGFPPFAVEAFVMTSFVLALWERWTPPARALAVGGTLGFGLVLFRAMDLFSVKSFLP